MNTDNTEFACELGVRLDKIMTTSGLRSQCDDKMNWNPVSVGIIAEEILDGRMNATGTVRDGRKHEKTGFSMKGLRHRVAVAIVEDKMSCSRTTEKFGVSKGFVFE